MSEVVNFRLELAQGRSGHTSARRAHTGTRGWSLV